MRALALLLGALLLIAAMAASALAEEFFSDTDVATGSRAIDLSTTPVTNGTRTPLETMVMASERSIGAQSRGSAGTGVDSISSDSLQGDDSNHSSGSDASEHAGILGVPGGDPWSDEDRLPIEVDEFAHGDGSTTEIVAFETTLATAFLDQPDNHLKPTLIARDSEPAAALEADSSSSQAEGESLSADEDTTESPAPEVTMDTHGVPSNPTTVTAVAFDGRAEVSWTTPDDDGSDPITEYEVAWFNEQNNSLVGTQRVAPTRGSIVADQPILSSTPTGDQSDLIPTSVMVGPLLNGRSYTFKVRAKNKNGYSVFSAKSLAVSPLHPPDLCNRVSCSGHGTCFPNYHPDSPDARLLEGSVAGVDGMTVTNGQGRRMQSGTLPPAPDGECVCRPGFSPPDCSTKKNDIEYVWTVTEWSECSSGCGGGKRTRDAKCVHVETEEAAPGDAMCSEKKPSLTRICNGMECGSKLVSVKYKVEMSYDEVLFSPESRDAFELAFTTEVSAALQIPRTRMEVTSIKRGSIAVFFQVLPASRVGEKSLNDIVELLQAELGNGTSTLRSKGTFARRIESNGVKVSFSIADQTVAGGAEDISVFGLIGTMMVLCSFVTAFGWFLRKRYERLMHEKLGEEEPSYSVKDSHSEMKRMGIRTMS